MQENSLTESQIDSMMNGAERFQSSPINSPIFIEMDGEEHSVRSHEPPSFKRACIECGKIHDTGWQNMKTGAMIERFNKCYDCTMQAAFKFTPLQEQVKLRDAAST